MRHDERVRVRPVRIDEPIGPGACSGLGSSESPRLAEALSIAEWNCGPKKIATVMDDMLAAGDSEPGRKNGHF